MSAINVLVDDAVFQKAIDEAPVRTLRFIEKTMRSSALLVQNTAKKLAPYDSGELKRSLTHISSYEKAEIGTDKVYGAIQEYGGTIKFKKRKGKVFIKAQPYLRPALKDNTPKILKKFDGLAKAINLK